MVKRKLKFKKKKNQRMNFVVFAASFLICCCIAISIIVPATLKKDAFYEIEDKQKAMKKSQKEDPEGVQTIGWIKVQGTKIDAPIITYEEPANLNYLEKDNFVWTDAKDDKYRNQVKILGHNILNLSPTPEIGLQYFTKFEDLMAYTYEDFVKENKYIQYTLGQKNYIYKIFAVLYEEDYILDIYNTEEYTSEKMSKYVELVKEKSLYNFEVEVNNDDNIIVLYTCTRMYGAKQPKQFAVVGRLLREDEKIENYEFTTTEQYKEILEIMKGVDGNEEL